MSDQKRNWFVRHKVLTVILIGVALVIIAGVAGGSSTTSTPSIPKNTGQTVSKQPAAKPVDKLAIAKSTVKDAGFGSHEVIGEITNNDSGKRSATLKATFYAVDGSILGTAAGAVNDIAPGETKTFTLLTTDEVASYKDMKVQVDTMF